MFVLLEQRLSVPKALNGRFLTKHYPYLLELSPHTVPMGLQNTADSEIEEPSIPTDS